MPTLAFRHVPRAALPALLLLPWFAAGAQGSMRTYNPMSQRRVGFIDPTGAELVAEARSGGVSPYIGARTFSDGFAAVQLADSTWTWIGRNGKRISDKRYSSISDFYEGYAYAKPAGDASKTVSVDHDGRERDLPGRVNVPRRSKFTMYFGADANKSRLGYMAPDGTPVTPAIFDEAGSMRNGRAFARKDQGGPLVMVDEKGRVIAGTGMFSESLPFLVDNRAPARASASGLYGYVDSEGKFVIAPAYAEASHFSGSRAAVKLPGAAGWTVINEKGEDVLKEIFVDAPVFYNDYARVKVVGSDTMKVVKADGSVTKHFDRNTREVGTNNLVSTTDANGRVAYATTNNGEGLPYARFTNRQLAQIGNPFIEGFATVYYRDASARTVLASGGAAADDGTLPGGGCKPGYVASMYGGCVKSQMREMGGGEPDVVKGAGPSGIAVTATNTAGLKRYVFYELRRTMAMPMGGASKNYAVYYGTVWAPMGTGVQAMANVFAERPRQTMMPTIRTDAVELTEDLDIDKVLIQRNRADFTVIRRNGKEAIQDNISYHALGEFVFKR